MKKICLHILILTAVALSLLSCAREVLPDTVQEEGIVLDFLCVSPTTKAGTNGTKDGEDPWNENYIQTLDVFFYTADGTSNNCVIHERFTPDNRSGKVSVTLYANDTRINTLVPIGNSFWVYAVANYPGTLVADESDLSGTSVDALKALQLSCDFSAASDHKQASFVMDGLAQVTQVDKEKRLIAKGEVQLRRVAAKITVQLDIAEQIRIPRVRVVDDVPIEYEEIWEPLINPESGMSVAMYIENAVSNTTLAAKPTDHPVYFSYSGNRMYFSKSSEAAYADYPWLTDPTYVYPQHWEYASKLSPTKEPTIKLILPWKRLHDDVNGVSATQKQFYYKIIIPDDTRAADGDDEFLRNFVRNNWYNFKMEVGMLGSETDDAAVLLSGTYYVVDWQDKDVVKKQAAIGKARFLSVEHKEYTVYNENTLDMLYTSSHHVALTTSANSSTLDITATKAYYGSKAANASYGGGTIRIASGHPDYPNGQKYIEYNATQRKTLNSGNDWLAINGEYVTLTHVLNNDISADEYLDTAPYIIRFNLYHADHNNDALYKQSVKITQYPAIYITNEISNGSVFLNGTNNTGNSDLKNLQDDSGNVIGTIVAPSSINDSGDNTNPRLYTIHISVLPSDSEYLIGDPRTDGTSAAVTTLNGLNASANYRPAAEDTQNIMAPAVVIASSYGKTSSLWYDNAQTRCAAYQENGYPAGRWRLPTSAELQYFVMLSEAGIIPSLFNPGMSTGTLQASNGQSYYYYSYYWSGGGYGFHGSGFDYLPDLKPLDGTGTPNYTFNGQSYYSSSSLHGVNHHSGYTRCVYDVWYWGEETDKNHQTSWSGYQTTK